MSEIGLFPLNLALLPSERAPLHIFEERYKELIGECLERSVPFGLILADESGMQSVGTETTVVEVINRYDDGRLDIIVEGERRVRIMRLTKGRSFATAEVEPLLDRDDPPDPADVEVCLSGFSRIVEAAGANVEIPDPGQPGFSYRIAAPLPLSDDRKQELLEMQSERERVKALPPLLEEALIAVKRQIAQRVAMGDGHVTG